VHANEFGSEYWPEPHSGQVVLVPTTTLKKPALHSAYEHTLWPVSL